MIYGNSKLNITTKDSSRKQVIVPISNDNKTKFIALLSKHITNINRLLKNIKSEVIADFICIVLMLKATNLVLFYFSFIFPLFSIYFLLLTKDKEDKV